jgi:hypothetical protein
MTIEQALKIMGMLSDAQECLTLGRIGPANVFINVAKKQIMLELYYSEWRSIDGVAQHPDGLTFEQWMQAKGVFISDPKS